ncbi:MAG: serine/threonine-protein kinase [Chloroflexota bacterium]
MEPYKSYGERILETQNVTRNIEYEPTPGPGRHLKSGVILSDRYLIQGVIGIGGMGAVYRARDMHFPHIEKLVAVKEMILQTNEPDVRKTIVENFEREAHILASLSHPSIPRIYDYFTEDIKSYLVLEFIKGKDLEAIINDMQDFIPEDQIISWAIELCEVLEYLHNHKPEPIIFRDMKPSNVMINQSNHVVLIDFGIAKPFEAGQKGTIIGTEGYSPPEQYRGEASPLADIYALGATLHHLLTRRNPQLEAPFSFGERQIQEINPGISPELVDIVNTALLYNPEERYQSAKEFKEALFSVAQKTGALKRISIPHSVPADSSKIKPLWTFECEDEIRSTPLYHDGVVYIGSYDNNLYALSAATGEFIWKYPTEGSIVGSPAIHEKYLYIGSEDYRLHAISSRSGKVVWTYFAKGPIRSSPRVAEGHVFFGGDDAHLHAVNLITGREAWRSEAAAAIRSTPFITENAVYFGCESGDFYCLDFSGQMKWRFKAKRGITSSPIVQKGVVFMASIDWTVYALDAANGWVIWRFRMGKGSISSPCVLDKLLFIGSADGFIYCLDTQTAKEIWRFRTDHQVSSSPMVYKDSLYCGSVDGSVYCLEYSSGRLRWKFQTDGPVIGSPIAHEDILYFGSTDHNLYALVT